MFPSHIKECGLVPLTQFAGDNNSRGHWYYPLTDEVFYQPDYEPPICSGCEVCSKPEIEEVEIPSIPDGVGLTEEVVKNESNPQEVDSPKIDPNAELPSHYLNDGTLVIEKAGANGPLYFAMVDGKQSGKALDVTSKDPLPINVE